MLQLSGHDPVINGSQGRNLESRAETETMEERNTTYWIAPHNLLIQRRSSIMGFAFLCLSTIKKNELRTIAGLPEDSGSILNVFVATFNHL